MFHTESGSRIYIFHLRWVVHRDFNAYADGQGFIAKCWSCGLWGYFCVEWACLFNLICWGRGSLRKLISISDWPCQSSSIQCLSGLLYDLKAMVLSDLLDGHIAKTKRPRAVSRAYVPSQRQEGFFEDLVCMVSECNGSLSMYEDILDQAHVWYVGPS